MSVEVRVSKCFSEGENPTLRYILQVITDGLYPKFLLQPHPCTQGIVPAFDSPFPVFVDISISQERPAEVDDTRTLGSKEKISRVNASMNDIMELELFSGVEERTNKIWSDHGYICVLQHRRVGNVFEE